MSNTYELMEQAIVYKPMSKICDAFFVFIKPDGFFEKMSEEWGIFLSDGDIPEPEDHGFSLLECNIKCYHFSTADDFDDADISYEANYYNLTDDIWKKIRMNENPLV